VFSIVLGVGMVGPALRSGGMGALPSQRETVHQYDLAGETSVPRDHHGESLDASLRADMAALPSQEASVHRYDAVEELGVPPDRPRGGLDASASLPAEKQLQKPSGATALKPAKALAMGGHAREEPAPKAPAPNAPAPEADAASSQVEMLDDYGTGNLPLPRCITIDPPDLVDKDLPERLEVDVVYSTTAAAYRYLLRSMVSMRYCLAPSAQLTIHLIVPPDDTQRAGKLIQCLATELKLLKVRMPTVRLYEMRQEEMMNMYERKMQGRLSKVQANFVRLYVGDYLVGLRRALWLDIDTIIRTDITKFFWMEMKSIIVVAQPHVSMPYGTMRYKWTWKHFRDASWLSFNSGVMLIDLVKWREAGIKDTLVQWGVHLRSDIIGFGDQFLANLCFKYNHTYDVIDRRYNIANLAQRSGCPSKCKKNRLQPEDGWILHYSGDAKPDYITCSPRNWCRDAFDLFKPQRRCRAF